MSIGARLSPKNILIIANRYTQSQDALYHEHFRLGELAKALSKHDFVFKAFIDYKTFQDINHGNSFSLKFNPFIIHKKIKSIILEKKIDVVIVMTGPISAYPVLFLSDRFIKKNNVQIVYDVQDNYDTYYNPITRKLTRYIDLKIRKKSNFVMYMNSQLQSIDKSKFNSVVVPTPVDISLFRQKNKQQCRSFFGLDSSFLVGYVGSVDRRVYNNILKISKILENMNIKFVVAGPTKYKLPSSIRYIGKLDPSKVPDFINSLDVGLSPYHNDDFSYFCSPLKTIEYMSCNVPVLGTPIPFHKQILPKDMIFSFDCSDFEKKLLKLKKRTDYSTKKIVEKYSAESIYEVMKNAFL